MEIYAHKWRAVFLTLLLGAVALATSMSALAGAPGANASASSNLNGTAPVTAVFDGSLSTCTPTCGYSWNFGDGSTEAGGVVTTHTYTIAGNYTATLTVTDVNGMTASASVNINVATDEPLTDYVATCEQQLSITASDIPATIDCNNALLFAPPTFEFINDVVGYFPLTHDTDLVFACRWLANRRFAASDPISPTTSAASVEMIIHNKHNGSTCFFAAKGNGNQSPFGSGFTNVAAVLPSPAASNASDFWMQPQDIENNFVESLVTVSSEVASPLKCAGCHVSGPYIASPRIAPFLAHFGLLNNGHDTGANPNNRNYNAVGVTFNHWNQDFITGFNVPAAGTCSSGCHSIANTNPPSSRPFTDLIEGEEILIPSIVNDIGEIEGIDFSFTGMNEGPQPPAAFTDPSGKAVNAMPANDSPFNPYRWVNMTSPLNGDLITNGDNETITALEQYPNLYCNNPTALEAHVIFNDFDNAKNPNIFATESFGSNNTSDPNNTQNVINVTVNDFVFSTNDPIPDSLATFNLRDGLVCTERTYTDASNTNVLVPCQQWSTRYLCNGAWTNWIHTDPGVITDPNTGEVSFTTGDNEKRANYPNLCASPTLMQAAYSSPTFDTDGSVVGSTLSRPFTAPNDRLAEFDLNGLRCNDVDQGVGIETTCSNYAVRFDCNGITPIPTFPPSQVLPPVPPVVPLSLTLTPLQQYQNSGSIGTTQRNFVVTSTINGWQASETEGRQIYINGVPVKPYQMPLPPRAKDGKYYFTFSAGGHPWASWSFW